MALKNREVLDGHAQSNGGIIPENTVVGESIITDATSGNGSDQLGSKRVQAAAWRETPPAGFLANDIDISLTAAALAELSPHFQGGATASRLAVEIGWTVDGVKAGRSRREAVEAHKLADFPCVVAMTEAAMRSFGRDCKHLARHRLNISCLKYTNGHQIKWHQDADYYEEPVFGCILQNTSDRTLQFFHRTATEVSCFPLEEHPGVCFLQEGEARYVWQHGVPKIGNGERISVTWRWFKL